MMHQGLRGYLSGGARGNIERKLFQQKRRQRGVTFPSARKQEHIVIIRLDLISSAVANLSQVREGLMRLCGLFERIDRGIKKMERLDQKGSLIPTPLTDFAFTVTIGFGVTFFEKLNIKDRNRPRKLYGMPSHGELRDSIPYVLKQTDLIIQLGSGHQEVNEWVLKNSFDLSRYPSVRPPRGQPERYQGLFRTEDDAADITAATRDWAQVTDKHSGFQRIDGRNLMGFNDGVSNPDRLSEDNQVWIKDIDERPKFREGTYMVFQKISHDLAKWEEISVEGQEEWIGRSKGTGLLLGTLTKDEDYDLALRLRSTLPSVRNAANNRLSRLLKDQTDPEKKIYSKNDTRSKRIQRMCPVWSHVRKANPRQVHGLPKRLIFRRGYLYTDGDTNSSGILFICFQNDIKNSFESIKKEWLNHAGNGLEAGAPMQNEPPSASKKREARGTYKRTSENKLIRKMEQGAYSHRPPMAFTSEPHTSEEYFSTVSLGGGYYFIPPIPKKDLTLIAEPFFE
jgi:Dyp-type peroxidase family